MEVVLISGLILGLTSNFHCLGMCGPIAMVLPVNRKNNWTILAGTLQYNLGRITTYVILGTLIGMIGMTIHVFGVLQWLSIIAGVGLVIYAWRKHFSKWFPKFSVSIGLYSRMQKMIGKTVKSSSPFRLFTFGFINGMLPCGMVYVALLNAMLVDEIHISALAMLAFGVGTLPVMISIPFFMHRISKSVRRKLNHVIPYMLTIVGVLIILRGMNLGIPYVSPSITTDAHSTAMTTHPEVSTIQFDCCHPTEKCETDSP